MKNSSTSKLSNISKLAASQTDWARLKSSQVSPAQSKTHPEAEPSTILRGMVRKGLQAVPAKASISLRIDQDVLDWYKAQGAGYQTRMNSVLRGFRDASV